ncbi:heme oxygenase [Kurthia huakuii]|jgi:heme oxygenase (staphylobilin-producing)|uniref:heme oxygenase n=1 Tax=Kurthia huakuii TaxID=1421019 RepID=UPI000496F263|nr:heme oxygenase [Kurthia huakuii]MBM7700664.1 heme oxygenase (staphylobilin-producing) [Kurthia huakuii]
MFIVTNRIKVKKGFAEKMAPRFTSNEGLKDFKGFVKTEVAVARDFEEYDEMSVNMFWESLEDFKVWRDSDAFQAAHKRPEPKEGDAPQGHGGPQADSPMLGSQIVVAEIVSSTEA